MKQLPAPRLLISIAAAVTLASSISAQTVVEKHGRLRAVGNRIVDKYDVPVSLAGNSLFWSIPGWGGDKYYNANVVEFLKTDWKSDIVRPAMGVEDGAGYISNPTANKNLLKTVVDACIAKGVYVIIDWHSHLADTHQPEAVAFFSEMAQTYGNKDNVIYEIWNEPVGAVSWPNTVKPYANAVIAAIRAHDPDNLIVVGNPEWSSHPDYAAANPVVDSNVAYTMHFYAGSHKQAHRDRVQAALNAGKAIFVTEWGTCAADGNGAVDTQSTIAWMDFLRNNKLSHCNWSINDKAEAASALKPGTSTAGGWVDANLTSSGLIVRKLVREWGGIFNEAEDLPVVASSDAVTSFTETAGPSAGVGDKLAANALNDYVSYTVNVPRPGLFSVIVRAKKYTTRGQFQLSIDGVNQGAAQDEYAAAAAYVEYDLGEKIFDTVGTRTFKFTVVGKNGSSSGFDLTFDSIRLEDHLGVPWEAESIATVSSSDPVTEHVDPAAGGGIIEKLNSNAVNDQVSYTINITEPGTYDIAVRTKKYSTRGQFQLAIDGVNQGSVQDQYAASAVWQDYYLGAKTFTTTGNKVFKFTVTGKNASSSGYDLVVDTITLLRD